MGKTKGEPRMRESIRVARFEVDSVDGANFRDDVQPRWFATMDLCRKAANLYYETWLVWHVQNQSALKLVDWFEQRKSLGIKEAGPCPVEVLPIELGTLIYDTIKTRYESIQINVVTQLMQIVFRTLSSGKAASGSLPKWSAILLHNQGMPMFTRREYPIPFSTGSKKSPQNAKLVKEGESRYIELKTWRLRVEGKSACVAVTDRVKLRMTGKRCKEQLLQFDKVCSGEWEFKGSQLVYDKNNKKWFINLCHQVPSRVEALNPEKMAYLLPGRDVPFHLLHNREDVWLQGRGNHILGMREKCWRKRTEMNYGNRKTLTLRRGHGRSAAMKLGERWHRKWREFVKRVNHAVSKDAVEWCVTHGVGTLVYLKPNDKKSATRFISGDFKNSTWEFFDLGSKLAYKCQDRGVTLKVVECGKTASGEVSPKTPGSLAATKRKTAARDAPSGVHSAAVAVAKSTGRKGTARNG